jgi:hypothetical protein
MIAGAAEIYAIAPPLRLRHDAASHRFDCSDAAATPLHAASRHAALPPAATCRLPPPLVTLRHALRHIFCLSRFEIDYALFTPICADLRRHYHISAPDYYESRLRRYAFDCLRRCDADACDIYATLRTFAPRFCLLYVLRQPMTFIICFLLIRHIAPPTRGHCLISFTPRRFMFVCLLPGHATPFIR